LHELSQARDASCKSQDHILKWKYLGDPDPRATWARTSKVVELVRTLQHPINCFACHDPHSAEPRVVRDALIQAVVDRGEGTYPYDKAKSQQVTMRKVTFRDFRAIGILNKPDSNVMCAQHSARYKKRDTCVQCHADWNEQQADYQIDAVQNYIRGKITKAEFWLGQLIDKYSEAKTAGAADDALRRAREAHDQAHIYWEWWTAENSDGFHNPAMARESLARSITVSQDGIKALDEALAKTRAK